MGIEKGRVQTRRRVENGFSAKRRKGQVARVLKTATVLEVGLRQEIGKDIMDRQKQELKETRASHSSPICPPHK